MRGLVGTLRLVPAGPLVDSRGRLCVTAHQAAAIAGVDRASIRRAIRSGRLPAERATWESHTGSVPWLIPVDHLRAYVDKKSLTTEKVGVLSPANITRRFPG